jgi:outer membrane protein OmpA-like peptidoglycan-associated protein
VSPRLVAAVLGVVTAGLVSAAATPAPDPLDAGEPTAAEIADSVTDLELEVTDIDVSDSVTDLEQESTEGSSTVVTLSSDILFAFGSDELSPAARDAVTELGRRVAAATGTVRVTGHTDSVGSDADNLALSQRRAQAVADVLVAAIGDGDPEVAAEGRGESEPVASNGTADKDDPAGRAQNRRVEVRFG